MPRRTGGGGAMPSRPASAARKEADKPLDVRRAGVDDRVGELVRRHEGPVQVAEDLERRLDVVVQELRRDVDLRDAAFDRAADIRERSSAAAVEDEAYFQACCSAICENRAWTVEKLEALGFTVLPSQANFIFAKSDRISGGDLYRKLKEHGILVRWFDSDRIRDYVRITIGSAEQMAALVDKIAQLL